MISPFGCLKNKYYVLRKSFTNFAAVSSIRQINQHIRMKNIIITTLILLFTHSIKAQNYDLITGGAVNDAAIYTQYYLAPLERGLGWAPSGGITNFTSSEHKLALTFKLELAAAITPKDQRSFNVDKIGLQEFKASDPNNSIAQSISGSQESIDLETKTTYYRPSVVYPFYKEIPLAEFKSAQGSGYPFSPLPILSFGVYGFGTHLSFRFLPPIHPSEEMDVSSYGFAVQHNLDEFIKIMKDWPLKISLSAGYQYFSLTDHLDIQPDKTKFGLELTDDNGPYDNQEADLKVSSIPMQLVVYHDFNGLTVYGGPAYTLTNSSFALKGNYPVYAKDPFDNFKIGVEDISDPISYERSYNGFRFDIGVNYQIGFAKINASYSIGKYQVFYLGLGFVFF